MIRPARLRWSPPTQRLSQGEFIALMAMLTAMVAFSIDAMLPALPDIGTELTPLAMNRAQLIVTSFVLGLGIGTLFTGPMSDAIGRRPVMIGGAVVYCIGALAAWWAPTLEMMLAARVLQGVGAAGPRVVALATVRDLYAGREMARIMSFVMIIFTLVPALAPSVGAIIIAGFGWRGIFLAFLIFAAVAVLWLGLRQPETLVPAHRRPLAVATLWAGTLEILHHPTARLSIAVQTLAYGMLFAKISTVQQVFDQTYDRAAGFPLWFGAIAIAAGSASILNAQVVVRIGMRPLIKAVLVAQIGISVLMIGAVMAPLPLLGEFWVYVFWTTSVFFMAGLTIGNLNALAMEPLGHIAGIAASVISAIATVGAVLIAVPIGLSFDGTPLPIAIGMATCAALALWLTTMIRREIDG